MYVEILRPVLGEGFTKDDINYSFKCPFCKGYNKSHKKLNVNTSSEKFHCWVCDTGGSSISLLLNKINANNIYFEKLKYISKIKISNVNLEKLVVKIPDDFSLLFDSKVISNKAFNYLKNRGLTIYDIVTFKIHTNKKHNILIPSYNEANELNYYVIRKMNPMEGQHKYTNAKCNKKDLIVFENFINWHMPITIVEGVFDAFAVKNNAIPLLGKYMSEALKMKLIQNRPEVYIILDSDAFKNSIDIANWLIKKEIKTKLILLSGEKDCNDLGFEKIEELKQQSHTLTYEELFDLEFKYLIGG